MGEDVKREKLSAQKLQSNSLRKFRKEIFCTIALSLLWIMSACNNLTSTSSRSPSSEVTFSDPNSGTGGSFVLNGVYASQQSPGSMYDMVGQDSQFDSYCSGTYGPCVCEYTYVSPGIGTVTEQGAVSYQESNLLRCVNEVPSGVSSFDVKILATGSGDYSNTITANLSSGVFVNTNYIDLSKEQAYTQVKRFQCRKREFILNPLSKNMVDPLQSEDPKVIYPFNFYSTNVAESAWQMQQDSVQDWDCTLTPTHDRTIHWWANPNVYSSSTCYDAFCAGDAELMYPQDDLVSGKIPVTNLSANGKRRGSFFVAKEAYGVFQVALKAATGPNTYVSSQVGTIGYAARPIPNTSGSSSCPSITLPSNAEWVKIWNFRATDITPPKYVKDTNASLSQSSIACNPATGIFASCDMEESASSSNAFGLTMSSVGTSPTTTTFPLPGAGGTYTSGHAHPPNITLASRVITHPSNLNVCYNIISMGLGKETWEPSAYAFSSSVSSSTLNALPWEILDQNPIAQVCADAGQPVRSNHIAGCNGGWYSLIDYEPMDSHPVTDTFNASNYTDQIFVITDPAVDDTLMRNQALAVSHYKPVTYRTSNDCNALSRSGCQINKEIHWDINIKDVGAPTGPDQYPLCVLQFTD